MTGFEVTMKTIAGDGEEDMGVCVLKWCEQCRFSCFANVIVFGGFWFWVVKYLNE